MSWSGIAPGLPTDLKPTLRITLNLTPLDMDVVGGADAVELATGKMPCVCATNVIQIKHSSSSEFMVNIYIYMTI